MPGKNHRSEVEVASPLHSDFLLLSFGLLRLADREQFYFEDQGGSGADVCAGAAIAVGEVGGDEELPLRSDWHQLQRFGPALDHAVHGEAGGLSALVGAVEFFAVDQGAAIVDGDRVGR